jgi:hypothetical protein
MNLRKLSNQLRKDKSGVFGLTSVQLFFGVIFAIALLAYVIVVIMGTLGGTTILQQTTDSYTAEVITPSTAGTALAANSWASCSASVSAVTNATNTAINAANYTVSGCKIANTTSTFPGTWKVTYSAVHDSIQQTQLTTILTNTSTGITRFFGAINPVYAILAVLVIILVLVVLVRVVQAPSGARAAPQL